MSRFSDTTSNVTNNLNYLVNNRLERPEYNSKKNIQTVDHIKDYLRPDRFNDMVDTYFGISKKKKHQYMVSSVYNETNEFYNENIRVSKLMSMLSKLTDNLIDEVHLEYSSEEQLEEQIINLEGNIKFDLSEKYAKKISTSILLYDEVVIKINVEDGDFAPQVASPFLYFKKDGYDWFVISANIKEVTLERRYVENGKCVIDLGKLKRDKYGKVYFEVFYSSTLPYNNTLVYSYETNMNIITNGVLELIMMYSLLFTSINKEIINTAIQIFMSKEYAGSSIQNFVRENFVLCDTPITTSIDTVDKPIYEEYSPQIRSSQLKELREILNEEIVNVLKLDKASLGIDVSGDTATATIKNSSQTENTINNLIKEIESVLTRFVYDLTGEEIFVKLTPFVAISYQEQVKFWSELLIKGAISYTDYIKLTNKKLDKEEQFKKVVLLKYENGVPMTVEEQAYAIANGIMIRQEF